MIEYDINSLVSFKKPKDKTYSKNRVIRTLDAIQETIQNNFPPTSTTTARPATPLKGIGQTILKQYEDMGAIKNVDYDADFKIDESLSSGDEVYFIVAIQPVDSAEKLFFTVKTR
ncbi:MAG: phage tail sheath C-terminal domain-containing protein [Oscillospiraceae bacterium]